MATTLYFRNANIGIATYNQLASTLRGDTAASTAGTTTAGGTWISLGFWATKPLQPFTLAGSVSVNLRGDESNQQANAGLGVRIYKWAAATKTLGSSLGQASGGAELGTAEGAVTGSVTPTSTAFLAGDVLVFEVGITNVGTMGTGRTVNFYFNGPTAAASGDSYLTLTENIVQHRRSVTTG